MKKIILYLPKIFLTFLLIFLLTGTELSVLVQHRLLTEKAFRTVAVQQNLDKKAWSALESYFKSRANSTGIPAEIYLDAVTQEDMKQGIFSSISGAFDYLYHNTETYAFTMDFTELETSVTEFFNQYADENHYQKDEVFQQKIQSAIAEAEEKILYTADTFKFGTIAEHNWLTRIRTFRDIFGEIMTVLCIITGVILLLLMLCCRRKISELCYWLGLTGLISGLLISVPCYRILKTDYFSGFVVKDIQIFSAVTGYLNYAVRAAATAGVITVCAGIISLILFTLIQKIKK